MGTPVLILGASGSGKTASLRNFEPNEIGIYNVANKALPFKKKLQTIRTSGYKDKSAYSVIVASLQKNSFRAYAIDDSQYLMAFYLFDKAKETGYQKFTDCALNFKKLIDFIVYETPDDTIVYLLHHIDRDDAGFIKAKTSGKMLDNQITLEGLFTIVLLAETDGHGFHFITQNNGYTTVKAPMDMFDSDRIDNDLKLVDTKIREYYGMKKLDAPISKNPKTMDEIIGTGGTK